MAERRGKGEDNIYFEQDGACRDASRHRRCPGQWRAEICLGYWPTVFHAGYLRADLWQLVG